MNLISITTLIGGLSLFFFFVAFVLLHILKTPYNPLKDPVSNYAVSKYGYLYNIQAFTSGICVVCLLFILKFKGVFLPSAGYWGFVIYSISRMLIFAFPTDINDVKTVKGKIHTLLAILTFSGIAVGIGFSTPVLQQLLVESGGEIWIDISAKIVYFSAVVFLIYSVIKVRKSMYGLVERLIYIGVLSWLATIYFSLVL
jgi:hypothetical protein